MLHAILNLIIQYKPPKMPQSDMISFGSFPSIDDMSYLTAQTAHCDDLPATPEHNWFTNLAQRANILPETPIADMLATPTATDFNALFGSWGKLGITCIDADDIDFVPDTKYDVNAGLASMWDSPPSTPTVCTTRANLFVIAPSQPIPCLIPSVSSRVYPKTKRIAPSPCEPSTTGLLPVGIPPPIRRLLVFDNITLEERMNRVPATQPVWTSTWGPRGFNSSEGQPNIWLPVNGDFPAWRNKD